MSDDIPVVGFFMPVVCCPGCSKVMFAPDEDTIFCIAEGCPQYRVKFARPRVSVQLTRKQEDTP